MRLTVGLVAAGAGDGASELVGNPERGGTAEVVQHVGHARRPSPATAGSLSPRRRSACWGRGRRRTDRRGGARPCVGRPGRITSPEKSMKVFSPARCTLRRQRPAEAAALRALQVAGHRARADDAGPSHLAENRSCSCLSRRIFRIFPRPPRKGRSMPRSGLPTMTTTTRRRANWRCPRGGGHRSPLCPHSADRGDHSGWPHRGLIKLEAHPTRPAPDLPTKKRLSPGGRNR